VLGVHIIESWGVLSLFEKAILCFQGIRGDDCGFRNV
jgi:hypothetical protein